MCVQSKSMQKYVENFGTATEILCQLKYFVFFYIHIFFPFSSTENFLQFLFFIHYNDEGKRIEKRMVSITTQ